MRRIIDNLDTGLGLAGAETPLLIEPYTGETVTYGEAVAFSHRFAHAARAHGLGPESKISTLAKNSPLMYSVALGIYRSDAIWLPLSARSGTQECVELLERFEADVLFYEAEYEEVVELARERGLAVACVPMGRAAVEDWIGDQPTDPYPTPGDLDTIYIIQATGGTTGLPKGVMFSYRNGRYMRDTQAAAIPHTPTELRPRPVFLANAPLTHAAERVMEVVMHRGGTAIVPGAATPDQLLALIERYGVTTTFLPPTIIYGMLDAPSLHDHDYSSLQSIIYGASPMAPEKLARAVETFGPVLVQIYGQTECGFPALLLTPADHFVDGDPAKGIASDFRLESAGRITPGTELVLLDDAGGIVPRGEPGEIAIRSEGVTPGYYRDAEATAAAQSTGYHRTGDIAFEDEEGYFHLVDRKKDMIITGGFNVYSAEVERVVLGFPGVGEAAVIGIPDEKWGEQVVAIVEPSPGAHIIPEALQRHVRGALGPVKTPKQVVVVEQLPRSAAGKVLKRELRAEYWRDARRQVS